MAQDLLPVLAILSIVPDELVVDIALDLLASDEHGPPTILPMNYVSVVTNSYLVNRRFCAHLFVRAFALLMGRSSVVTNFGIATYDRFWDREPGSKTEATGGAAKLNIPRRP